MTWRRDVAIYLDDIVEAAGKALQFTEGLTVSEFERNDRTAFAVVRALEIPGEAARMSLLCTTTRLSRSCRDATQWSGFG